MAGIWWLASYPKSGNTWLRAFIVSLISGEPVDINKLAFPGGLASQRSAFDEALGLAAADLTLEQQTNLRPRAYEIWAAEAERPLYCKAHDCYHATPSGEPLFPTKLTRGAVYVVRDPRAVAVSLAHHTGQTIDAAIARMADENATFSNSSNRLAEQLQQRLQSWSNHVKSWLKAPFPLHVVRYEDVHVDPTASFGAVARFLGLPHDPERIAAAVAATDFSRLQAQERAFGFVERPPKAAAFFREGRVNGWQQTLTTEQAAHIEHAHGPMMLRLGYELTAAGGPIGRICGAPSAA
jgi:aryl sulfotransferase